MVLLGVMSRVVSLCVLAVLVAACGNPSEEYGPRPWDEVPSVGVRVYQDGVDAVAGPAPGGVVDVPEVALDELLGGVAAGNNPWLLTNGLWGELGEDRVTVEFCLEESGLSYGSGVPMAAGVLDPFLVAEDGGAVVASVGFLIRFPVDYGERFAAVAAAGDFDSRQAMFDECYASGVGPASDRVAAYYEQMVVMNASPAFVGLNELFLGCLVEDGLVGSEMPRAVELGAGSPPDVVWVLVSRLLEVADALSDRVTNPGNWVSAGAPFGLDDPDVVLPAGLGEVGGFMAELELAVARSVWECYEPLRQDYVEAERLWVSEFLPAEVYELFVSGV